MTKEQLINKLIELAKHGDSERAHIYADQALLEYIGDPDVTAAFEAIHKLYA